MGDSKNLELRFIINTEVIVTVKWGVGSHQMDSPHQMLPRGFTSVIAVNPF